MHLADIRLRVYDRHRLEDDSTPGDEPVHEDDDTANTLTVATSLLDTAIVAYLDALAELSPATPANEPGGAHEATHRYGFTKNEA